MRRSLVAAAAAATSRRAGKEPEDLQRSPGCAPDDHADAEDRAPTQMTLVPLISVRVLRQKREGLSKLSPSTPPPASSRQPPLQALTPLATAVAAT